MKETIKDFLQHPSNEDIIILEDTNRRVGNDNSRRRNVIGREEENKINNNGERLLQFRMDDNLTITNTKFRHKDIHKYTKIELAKEEKPKINYIIVKEHQTCSERAHVHMSEMRASKDNRKGNVGNRTPKT